MKKYLLLGIGLLWVIGSFAQNGKNSKDEFTYTRIKVKNSSKGVLPITGSSNNSLSKNNDSSKSTIFSAGGNGSGIGETKGELSVSLTGGAKYDIPIMVPSGINGVVPEVSLTYKSQIGNGLAGYGWNISGVSVISRIPSTKFHDNNIDAVDFDNLDRFSLDGERLVLKSGSYGSNGAQYATENYSNVKITSYGTSPYGSNFGPSHFIINYPDGSFAHYGSNSNSRTQTNYSITYWQNAQGIRISYEYLKEYNSIAISKIKYGSRLTSNPINEIRFLYKTRKRYEQSYVGNIIFQRKKILDDIQVYSGGSRYRSYKLTHQETNLGYERLIQLQEKSGDLSKLHTPILFSYNSSGTGVSYNDITTDLTIGNIEQRNAETVSLDLSGNGKMDFIVYPKTNKNKFWVFKDLQNGNINYPIEVNSGLFEALFPVTWLTHNNKILSGQGIAVIQKTTNNRIKFKVYSNGTTAPIYYQYEKIWNAPTYSYEFNCTSTPNITRVPQKYISGDFNGDGLSDVIAISEPYSYSNCIEDPGCDGGDPYSIQRANTTNVQELSTDVKVNRVLPPGGGEDCCVCNTEDVNYSKVTFINLDRRITSNFTKNSGYLSISLQGADKLLAADVNGDGKTDILQIREGKIYVYTLDNNDNLQLLWQTNDSKIKLEFPLLLGDYNGDGKTDFMIPHADNSNTFYMYLSSGTRFILGSNQSYPFTYKKTNWDGNNGVLYGYNLIPLDVNGDGRTDIINYTTTTYNNSSNGTQSIHLYENSKSNYSNTFPKFTNGGLVIKNGNVKHFPIPIFLTSDKPNKNLDFASISNNWITNFSFNEDHRENMLMSSVGSNGIFQFIDYNNLDQNEYSDDNFRVYQQSYSQSYPNIDLQIAPGTKVVTLITRTASGLTAPIKQAYSYYGAVFNMEGLGFLGFQGIAKSNWYTGSTDRIFNVSKFDTHLRGAKIEEYLQPNYFNLTSIPSNYFNKLTNVYSSSLASNNVFKLSMISSINQDNLKGTVISKTFTYDNYNNPTNITTNFSGDGSSVIDITYANSTGSTYYIGRPTNESETRTIGGNSFNTEKQFSYTGYLLTQKKTKGNNTSFDIENYEYDIFGNIEKETTIPNNTAARELSFEYDTSGRFLKKSYDVEGLLTTYLYNTNTGTLSKLTNPFGQETNFEYDAWNRIIKVTDYLGKNLYTTYVESSSNSYTITESGDDNSEKITIYDKLKRLSAIKEKDVLGQWVSKSYQYDDLDRVTGESEPYIGSAASQWNTTEYDFYGRKKSTTTYSGKVTNITYNNLSVVVNDGTKTVTTLYNAIGNITQVTDPGGTINYTYFGNGNIKTTNYDGVVISTEQDGWGRKTKTIDPSAGTYTYTYNGFGEITNETTPKGSTDYTYSNIGKLTQKKVVGDFTDMTMQYVYNSTNKKVSSISLINTDGNNSTTLYTYDSHQRLDYTSEINAFAEFTKRYTYDAFGRIKTEENKARLLASSKSSIKKIKNTYQNGILKVISDNSTQEVLWNVDAINARGQITSTTMGNNLRILNTFNNSGYLTKSKSEKNINTSALQMMQLTFDFNAQRGLLNSRTNSLFSWSENFTYDNLDRLVSFNDNNGNNNHVYDSRGRISMNNNLGDYDYTGNSYQLKSIVLNGTPHYEGTIRQDISYNAFKSPVEIHEEGIERINFQYNAFMGRANMFYGNTESDKLLRPFRKHYSSDGSMEITFDQTTGKTTFVNFIGGDAYSSPVIWHSEQGSTTVNNYYFLFRDYLGSILMISDKNGVIKEKRHFDAWGNIVKLTDGYNSTLQKFKILDRGYTGHEHLLGVKLIHMNGRLYDPIVHRFLAPDNYIQNPYNTQNYNRYGYVLNNPLKYTDPSGEFIFESAAAIYYIISAAIIIAAAIWGTQDVGWSAQSTDPPLSPTVNNNNSQNVSSNGMVIRDGGYTLVNPYGIYQSTFLESGTSSGLSYSASGPSDWIDNGSNLGNDNQKFERPSSKVNLNSSDAMEQLLDWLSYMNRKGGNYELAEIFDYTTVPQKHWFKELFGDMMGTDSFEIGGKINGEGVSLVVLDRNFFVNRSNNLVGYIVGYEEHFNNQNLYQIRVKSRYYPNYTKFTLKFNNKNSYDYAKKYIGL